MKPPIENLIGCLGNDSLWHYGNVPPFHRFANNRGQVFLALCGKEVVYAGDGHQVTCIQCIRDWSTW